MGAASAALFLCGLGGGPSELRRRRLARLRRHPEDALGQLVTATGGFLFAVGLRLVRLCHGPASDHLLLGNDSVSYPHLTHDPRFQQYLGSFFAGWANIELLTSYLIGKLLKITDEEAHVVTSGMMFGTKARLLRNLLYRSNHPNKAVLTGALNRIQNSSKRDAFAHSFILSGPQVVNFIERPGHGDYQAKEHSYTLDEFLQHVRAVTAAMQEFQAGLEVRSTNFLSSPTPRSRQTGSWVKCG